jgi:superfamily II DNA or RNA helicase
MVGKTAGDFNTRELSQRMSDDAIVLKTAASIIETYAGRCTLVFCVDTAHANKMAWALTNPSTGVPGCAKALHYKVGNDDEVRAIKDEFKAGMFPILVTVEMASYGFDHPPIQLIRMCRPTMSLAVIMQQIGRGSRPLPGVVDGLLTAAERRQAIAMSAKPFCEVHDDAYNTKNPKLAAMSVVDAFAGDEYTKEDIRRATKNLQSKRTPGSVLEELERAKKLREEREKREREAIQSVAVKTVTTFEKGELFSLIGVSAPMYGVERNGKMATDKQIERIRKIFKAEPPPNLTRAEAGRIIGKWRKDLDDGNVSVRQRMYLRKPPFNMNDQSINMLNAVHGQGFKAASAILSARWGKKK